MTQAVVVDLEREPEMLKVGQAAKKLNVARQTIYSLIKSGEIPHIKIGGCIRIPKDKLLALMAGK